MRSQNVCNFDVNYSTNGLCCVCRKIPYRLRLAITEYGLVQLMVHDIFSLGKAVLIGYLIQIPLAAALMLPPVYYWNRRARRLALEAVQTGSDRTSAWPPPPDLPNQR
jgi:hypothetical protein